MRNFKKSRLVINLITASEPQFKQIICFRKKSGTSETGVCLVAVSYVSKGHECQTAGVARAAFRLFVSN